jgi:hypothetical protein
MSDTPNAIIKYDVTHNTVLRIGEQGTVNQIYYPRQVQIQTYQGTTISKYDVQGLQVLDVNNNWYYINKMFTFTDNSILLCNKNIKELFSLVCYMMKTNNNKILAITITTSL